MSRLFSVGLLGALLTAPLIAQCTFPFNCAPVLGPSAIQGENGALSFDGNDHVTIAVPAGVADSLTDFTIEVWFRYGDANLRSAIASKWGPDLNSRIWSIETAPGGVIRFYRNNLLIIETACGNLADGQWHHYAITKFGATYSASVDARPSGSAIGPSAPLWSSPEPLVLGNRFLSAATQVGWMPFVGQLDLVRIWNRALNCGTLRTFYRRPIPTGHPDQPVASWRLDEESGPLLFDSRGGVQGLLGSSALAESSDPTRLRSPHAPMRYLPSAGGGQANTAAASMSIDSFLGPSLGPAPWLTRVARTPPNANRVLFRWSGTPGASVILIAGQPAVAAGDLGFVGQLDLDPRALFVALDGTANPATPWATLDANGSASLDFRFGFIWPGSYACFQSLIVPSGGTPSLTAMTSLAF